MVLSDTSQVFVMVLVGDVGALMITDTVLGGFLIIYV